MLETVASSPMCESARLQISTSELKVSPPRNKGEPWFPSDSPHAANQIKGSTLVNVRFIVRRLPLALGFPLPSGSINRRLCDSLVPRTVKNLDVVVPWAAVLKINDGLSQFGTASSYLSFLGVPLRRVDSLINAEARIT